MADLINRDHAAQAIEAYLCSQCDYDTERDPECIACPYLNGYEILKSVPIVNLWISVEDALPEIGYNVLVTRQTESNARYTRIASRQDDCWMDSTDKYGKPNPHPVIAWMPMPDAYEPLKEGADHA